MAHELLEELHKAGVPCSEMREWCRCQDSRGLEGPGDCELAVITALVDRLVTATRQTDRALEQRDYWKGVADRLTDVVIGYRTADPAEPVRQRPHKNRIFEEDQR